MKKHLLILIAVMLLFSVNAYSAGNDLFHVGSGADNNEVRIGQDARLYGDGDYSVVLVSGATTDTLTGIESGKVIICNTDGQVALPDAATATIGAQFRFSIVGAVTSASGLGSGQNTLKVNPYLGDTINYTIGGTALTANQSLNATGVTDDSLWIVCTAANTWYVVDIAGTWIVGN